MADNTPFVLAAIIALVAVVVIAYLAGREVKRKRLTPLASLAFACIVAGLVFNQERVMGYGLLGVGVILAVIDALQRMKNSDK